jgi:hypothetical protein
MSSVQAGADPREPLGRLVHDTRVAAEADQAAAEGRHRFNLGSWEDRTDAQRELDERIYSAVAARAVADAGLENDRARMLLAAFGVHRGAIFDALAVAIAGAVHEDDRKRWRDALRALGGEEDNREGR